MTERVPFPEWWLALAIKQRWHKRGSEVARGQIRELASALRHLRRLRGAQ